MPQLVLEATYQQGRLILDRHLDREKEGKKFKVILLEDESLSAKRVFPIC